MTPSEIFERDDWELQWILHHKKYPEQFPMDIVMAKKTCEECLFECETGMVLGEGWHGGMTREEWEERKQYYERVLNELK